MTGREKRRRHDDAVWAFTFFLRLSGIPAADEVGIRGGRIDIVSYTPNRVPEWAIEVKTNPDVFMGGVKQIVRYADLLPAPNRLLVVDTPLDCEDLRALAASYDVHVLAVDVDTLYETMRRAVDGTRPSTRYYVAAPYIHPETVAVATEKIMAANREWRARRAVA